MPRANLAHGDELCRYTGLLCTQQVQLRPYGSPVAIALRLTISSLATDRQLPAHTLCRLSYMGSTWGAEAHSHQPIVCVAADATGEAFAAFNTSPPQAVHSGTVSWQTLPCCTWPAPHVEDASATPVLAVHQSKVGCRVP